MLTKSQFQLRADLWPSSRLLCCLDDLCDVIFDVYSIIRSRGKKIYNAKNPINLDIQQNNGIVDLTASPLVSVYSFTGAAVTSCLRKLMDGPASKIHVC